MTLAPDNHENASLVTVLRSLTALLVAAAIWLPCLGFICRPHVADYRAEDGIGPQARLLANRQAELWSHAELRRTGDAQMRESNAEWDFMHRTFTALAFANIALRDPTEKQSCLDLIDQVITDTIATEKNEGMYHFMMDYARTGLFVAKPAHSLFLDGEIAIMLASRLAIESNATWEAELHVRTATLVNQMRQSPVRCGESYPDECWTFCNSVAVAALAMSDAVTGTDHRGFIGQWLDTAKKRLIHPATGLLVSSFMFDGTWLDGPEGSSIWMTAHCLELVDPAFAADQYRRAKSELGRSLFGFGYAREWPSSWKGPMDVDSGPVIPLLGLSAGSSGLAFVGAAGFDDTPFLQSLIASLRFGGFPVRKGQTLRFAASNDVGDAVLLYAWVQGPLWDRIHRLQAERLAARGHS